jgi:hypothetical protein
MIILNNWLQFDIYAKEVEKEKASFSHYNILPLNISGQRQPVMEIPEVMYFKIYFKNTTFIS